MTEKNVLAECDECESTFNVNYDQELVSDEYPEFCPFCGERIEEVQEEYIDDDDFDEIEEWD